MLFALALTPLSCSVAALPDAEPESDVLPLAVDFDPTTCGAIAGRVIWSGPIPAFTPTAVPFLADGQVHYRQYPNPNAFHIDQTTHAISGAVVYLETVPTCRSRPWDHPPVRIELSDLAIRVSQGDAAGNVGFVQRGHGIEMVSRDAGFQALSARGAAFFSLTFPDPDRPLQRTFRTAGIVDLSSGAAKYWQQAYLFVCDHPYYALTDAAGQFALRHVPAGDYTLVCWHPNGTVASVDRDPNTGQELRRHFSAPLERRTPVTVGTGKTMQINFQLER